MVLIIEEIVKIIKFLFDSNLVGVIVGFCLSYFSFKFGKVIVEIPNYEKYEKGFGHQDFSNWPEELKDTSFVTFFINTRRSNICISDYRIEIDGKEHFILADVEDKEAGDPMPRIIKAESADTIIFQNPYKFKKTDNLIIKINGKDKKVSLKTLFE